MHVWGHQLKCQVLYAPSRVDGAGTLSYENIEQHWSKFYGFIASIQRMDWANRVDRTSSLSENFARKAVSALVQNMGKDFKEAVKLESTHSKALNKLLRDLEKTEAEVILLINRQKALFSQTNHSGVRKNQDDVDYANAIDDYASLLVDTVNNDDIDSDDDLNSDPALDVDSDLGDAAYSAAILEQRAKNKEADLEAARNLVESIEGKRRKRAGICGRTPWMVA